MAKTNSDASGLLADLSQYIYGTTRVGDDKIPFTERVNDSAGSNGFGCLVPCQSYVWKCA